MTKHSVAARCIMVPMFAGALLAHQSASAQTASAQGWPTEMKADAAPAPEPKKAGAAATSAALTPTSKPASTVVKPAVAARPTTEPGTAGSAELLRALQRQGDMLTRLAAEFQAQRAVIAEQQEKIKALERGVTATSTQAPAATAPAAGASAPGATLRPASGPALPPTTEPGVGTQKPAGTPSSSSPPTSPLAIHVGDADLLIGGFMDATAITRSTNHGSGIGTSFGTIPFSAVGNVPQAAGNLSETRFSTQNSRLTLQATSKVGGAALKGYMEVDFLGNAPANLNVTSNANTLRMRLYWVQYRQGRFELLGGQSWSLLTPSRNGLSPVPGDLFYTQDVDTNYQMGLTWGRTTQFRFVAHASDTVSAGVSLENPQQYVGTAVVLPAAFPAGEVDATGNTAAPNAYPDVIGKISFDPKTGRTRQHLDAAVLVRGYKTYNPASNTSFSATGIGTSLNLVVEPVRNVRLVATSFLSSGGGRYIANTNGPDFIVMADGRLSLVKSRSFIVGPEIQAGTKTLLYGYYSDATFDQNVTLDVTGKPIGFGVPGSMSANHRLNETTVGLTQTFFRDPRIGGMQLMVQFSTIKRTPFAVPAGTPTDATLKMLYFNLRYVLP